MTSLEQFFRDCNMALDTQHVQQMETFLTLFQKTNQQLNLSAIRDEQDIKVKHLLDSLHIGALAEMNEGQRVLDLGTGGGFPGMPLKIMHPGAEMVFLDATGKKLRFIESAAGTIGMDGVYYLHSRAEDAGQDPRYRGTFDLVLARAVAYLPVLLEFALPLLRVGGRLASAKGAGVDDEVHDSARALRLLGGKVESVKTYQLPGIAEERSVILIRKVSQTPREYPRRAGIPAKKPL